MQKLTPGFKNDRNLDNFRQAVERPKTWNLMATFVQEIHLSKTYIPSAKTNTEDLSNIIFNYLCENLPNDLCQFWSHKSFFTSVFLWLKHYTLFPQLALKSTKFLMSFFKQKVSFSSKFGSFFSIMRDNISLLFFSWNFIRYGQKQYIKVQIFRLSITRIKIYQISYVIFGIKSQFFFKMKINQISI